MDSFDILIGISWLIGAIFIIFGGRKRMITPEDVAKGQSFLQKFAQEAENYALTHDAFDNGTITEKDDLLAKKAYDTAYNKLDDFIQRLGDNDNE